MGHLAEVLVEQRELAQDDNGGGYGKSESGEVEIEVMPILPPQWAWSKNGHRVAFCLEVVAQSELQDSGTGDGAREVAELGAVREGVVAYELEAADIEDWSVGDVECFDIEHDGLFAEGVPGFGDAHIHVEDAGSAEIVALSGLAGIGEAELIDASDGILKGIDTPVGAVGICDHVGAGLRLGPAQNGVGGELPVGRPEPESRRRAEGQCAGPVGQTGGLPSADDEVEPTAVVHPAATHAEGELVHPVGIDLMACVPIGGGVELFGAPRVDDLTAVSKAGELGGSFGVGAHVFGPGEGVVELELQRAGGAAQDDLSRVVAAVSDSGLGVERRELGVEEPVLSESGTGRRAEHIGGEQCAGLIAYVAGIHVIHGLRCGGSAGKAFRAGGAAEGRGGAVVETTRSIGEEILKVRDVLKLLDGYTGIERFRQHGCGGEVIHFGLRVYDVGRHREILFFEEMASETADVVDFDDELLGKLALDSGTEDFRVWSVQMAVESPSNGERAGVIAARRSVGESALWGGNDQGCRDVVGTAEARHGGDVLNAGGVAELGSESEGAGAIEVVHERVAKVVVVHAEAEPKRTLTGTSE